MKEITVKNISGFESDVDEWQAEYDTSEEKGILAVNIRARSSLVEIIIAKIMPMGYSEPQYYISSPNLGVAIPSINSLEETFWIAEKLTQYGMGDVDAVTTAKVLADIKER